jgi:serine/threonine protein kinase
MGVVYLAYWNGSPVAVKKVIDALVSDDSPNSSKYRDEFIAEMEMLSQLHHPHILRLLGGSIADNILVTEFVVFFFVSGRSTCGGLVSFCHAIQILQTFSSLLLLILVFISHSRFASRGDLFSMVQAKNPAIQWEKRGKFMARDIAHAVSAMHSKRIIHRDLKSPNILVRSPSFRLD